MQRWEFRKCDLYVDGYMAPSDLRDLFISFFFFQAEDGIRDIGVTGVQTCALPISRMASAPSAGRARRDARGETAGAGRRRHSRVFIMNEGPLSGRAIVVTRPREHAAALAERIRAAGADPILFPTIEILPVGNAAAVSSLIARLDGFQLAIFVSPTAVMRGHAMVLASRK